MPEENELTLEEFDSLLEESTKTPRPPQSIPQLARGTAANVAQQEIPGTFSPSRLLGRKNIFNDIMDMGQGAVRTLFDPMEALQGFPTAREQLNRFSKPEVKPELRQLTGRDIAATIPDITQAGLVSAAQAAGGRVGPLGSRFAGAAASLPASYIAETIRESSPDLFGEAPTTNIGGVEVSPTQLNFALDAVAPFVGSGVGKEVWQGIKEKVGTKIVKQFGEQATDDLAKAYSELDNPSNAITFTPEQRLQPTLAATSGQTLKNAETVIAGEGLSRINKINEQKFRQALLEKGGLTEEELIDLAIPPGTSQELSQLPERRGQLRAPSGTAKQVPSVTRGMQVAVNVGRRKRYLTDKSTENYQYVRDNLAAQGDTTIPIEGTTRQNLEGILEDAKKYAKNPELEGTFSGLIETLSNVLGKPQTKTSVRLGQETITKTEKTITKAGRVTKKNPIPSESTTFITSEAKAKNVPEGIEKTFEEQTYKGESVDAPLLKDVQSISLKSPLEQFEESLDTGIDYNDLVMINSELKKTFSSMRAGTVPFNKAQVAKTAREIDSSIVEGLRNKPNGRSLTQHHQRGSTLTSLRYQRYPEEISNLITKEEAGVVKKALDDPATMNSLIKTSGNRRVIQQEVYAEAINSAYDAQGNFVPKKALDFWQTKKGIRNAYTGKQYNAIENYLKVASSVTPEPSHIGMFASQFRGANLLMNLGGSAITGIGGSLGGIPGAATGVTMWFGGKAVLKKIMLDPRAAEIATGLLKTPARSPRALSQMRQLLPYLHGVKVTVNMGNHSFETEVNSDLISQIRFANQQATNSSYDLLNQVKSVAAQ